MTFQVGKSYVRTGVDSPFTVVAEITHGVAAVFRGRYGIQVMELLSADFKDCTELNAVFDLDVHLTQGPDGYQATAVPHGQAVAGSLSHTTVRLGAPAIPPRGRKRKAKA